jgi:tRNA G10  N-methylase Trm11
MQPTWTSDCGSVVLYNGDCLEVLPHLSGVDAVVTDPPYPKEFLPLYEGLAEASAKCLADGGLLAAMCGHVYLPQIFEMMGRHLSYRWTVAYLTPGAQAAQIWPRRAIAFWKPVLVYSKGSHGL